MRGSASTLEKKAAPPDGGPVAVPWAVGVGYALAALGFSLGLLLQARSRGLGELAWWLLPYAGLSVFSLVRPRMAPLLAGLLAFVLGFARTHQHGPNLDLGAGLIALAVGAALLDRLRRGRTFRTDIAGLALLAVAVSSVLSLGFVLARVRGFSPAPGFAYHVFRYNDLGISSDEVLLRAVSGAALVFLWFGLYEYARTLEVGRKTLGWGILAALLANSAALLVQRHLAPAFLHPAGFPLVGRLNGVTSFCYALGDATAALFLLLPAWGGARGAAALRTAAAVLLLGHAAVASGSRSALAVMLGATLVWLLLRAARSSAGGRLARGVALLAGAAALVLAFGVTYRLTPADQTTPIGRLKEGIEREGVFGHLRSTRLDSYPLVLRVLREYPLAGVGVGIYPAEVDKQRALLEPGAAFDPYLAGSYAPNQFLNTAAELGLPALLALVAVFGAVLLHACSRGASERARDLGVSVLVLAGALQLGPAFYNSEALVPFWLLLGLAAAAPRDARGAHSPGVLSLRIGVRASATVLAAALAVGLGGQLLARPSLAIERQWQQLRWRLNIGLQPPEPDGRWTGAEATFSTKLAAPAARVRWHAGDPAAPAYTAQVSFYVDGVLAERTLARSGRVRESVLPLPGGDGFKRISVRVSPPFVPADAIGGSDRRELGIFLHSVGPADPSPRRPAP